MSDDQKNEQDKPSFVPEPKEKKDENKQKKNYKKRFLHLFISWINQFFKLVILFMKAEGR